MFSIEEIKSLIDKVSQSGLALVELQEKDFKLVLKGREAVCASAPAAGAPVREAPSDAPGAEIAAPAPVPAGNVVTAPIVGTFYAAAAPDKPPLAPAGKSVKKGDVLFIIESMKLMNEVLAERDGQVAEVLVENGAPVEFGQPVLRMA
ncbi:MAG: acetyl-CoA carboxylase biotin carboxyl carrier protein [Oscillospiraceae bacterium]|nr:acetyl-CoA carboxylase biotin carboxyl carrier protein [Oscillospiraceae bacterium]MDY4190954.1 acetyl-CoA carboxylase biotin carboxyl carrier protein [Oscillospiraceae bacterium]